MINLKFMAQTWRSLAVMAVMAVMVVIATAASLKRLAVTKIAPHSSLRAKRGNP